ncbi:hypothetical protein D3C72_1913820 [compost metagenome]
MTKAAMKRAWEIRGAQRREHPKSMAKSKTQGRRGLTTRYPRGSILHGYLETASDWEINRVVIDLPVILNRGFWKLPMRQHRMAHQQIKFMIYTASNKN